MKIITISREFGSGGRELGRKIAQILGYDYYDKEIITAIAEQTHLEEGQVEHALETHQWQTLPLTLRHSFASCSALSLCVPHLCRVGHHSFCAVLSFTRRRTSHPTISRVW